MASMVQALTTAEYKLVKLQQYLTGELVKTIKKLGYSPAMY